MRCVKCGKESRETYCEACYFKEHSIIKNYKKIKLTICTKCGRHLYRNSWFYDKISELIRDSIVFDERLQIDSVSYELGDKEVKIAIKAHHGEEKIEQDFSLTMNGINKICEDCSKQGQYFEAVLQLRNPRQDIIDFIEEKFRDDKKAFINKKNKVPGGIDFYLSSNKHAQRIGRELQDRFGGELKVSPRLHTRDKQSGKDLYRLSVLFRPHEFKKGDVILVDDKLIKIGGISKNITGTDIITNKKRIIERKKTKLELLEVYKASVSKTHPHLEVINPLTYESVRVENSEDNDTTSKEINVVINKDKIYRV